MNRRDWLAAIGALGLTALVPRLARAAAADPKRLLLFWTPNGTVMDEWWGPSETTQAPILAPLSAFADRILPVRGLDMKVAMVDPVAPDHLPDIRSALSGQVPVRVGQRWTCPGATVDQFLASRMGPVTRLPSLELAVQPIDRLCYAGADRVVQPHTDPSGAFDRVFSDVFKGKDAAAAIRARRQSVLDLVGQELSELSGVLGVEERRHLDAHTTAVREVERAIQVPDPALDSCEPVAPGALNASSNPELFPEVGRQMMDVAALALSCDMTRIVTLQWSGAASPVVHTWAGVDSAHHPTAHQLGLSQGEARARLVAIERWYATQFASLLTRLQASAAQEGSLLDHTTVVWCHEQSDGATHGRADMPYVLAGNVRGGRRIHFDGVVHNRLLVTLCHLMGQTDVTHFGDPAMPGGELADLL